MTDLSKLNHLKTKLLHNIGTMIDKMFDEYQVVPGKKQKRATTDGMKRKYKRRRPSEIKTTPLAVVSYTTLAEIMRGKWSHSSATGWGWQTATIRQNQLDRDHGRTKFRVISNDIQSWRRKGQLPLDVYTYLATIDLPPDRTAHVLGSAERDIAGQRALRCVG